MENFHTRGNGKWPFHMVIIRTHQPPKKNKSRHAHFKASSGFFLFLLRGDFGSNL